MRLLVFEMFMLIAYENVFSYREALMTWMRAYIVMLKSPILVFASCCICIRKKALKAITFFFQNIARTLLQLQFSIILRRLISGCQV
jgi:hypothetical protein